ALTPKISRADQLFLQAVGTGTSAGWHCGRRGRSTTGAFFPAARLTELLIAFDDVVSPILGGVPQPGQERFRVCSRRACASGRRTFQVDRSLRRFHVLVDLGAKGMAVELRAPGSSTSLILLYPKVAWG